MQIKDNKKVKASFGWYFSSLSFLALFLALFFVFWNATYETTSVLTFSVMIGLAIMTLCSLILGKLCDMADDINEIKRQRESR